MDSDFKQVFCPWWKVQDNYEKEIMKHAKPMDIDIDKVDFSRCSILSTENPKPNSWLRSFMKEENIDLAEKIKDLSDKQKKAMKDLEKMLFDSLLEGIDEMVEKEADATFFLILQASIAANIPLKKAYETYFIKREEVAPLAQRFDERKISQYVCGEYRFRLMVRDEPIEIPEDAWKSYLGGLYERLIKKLEIDICKEL